MEFANSRIRHATEEWDLHLPRLYNRMGWMIVASALLYLRVVNTQFTRNRTRMVYL